MKADARRIRDERAAEDGAAAPAREARSAGAAAGAREAKPLVLSLVEHLERNWALSAALVLAAIMAASAF